MLTPDQRRQNRRVLAQMLVAVCQVEILADHRRIESTLKISFADTLIEDWRLPSWIGADQQQGVRRLDASQRRIKQVASADRRINCRAVLAAINMGRTEAPQQIAQRQH